MTQALRIVLVALFVFAAIPAFAQAGGEVTRMSLADGSFQQMRELTGRRLKATLRSLILPPVVKARAAKGEAEKAETATKAEQARAAIVKPELLPYRASSPQRRRISLSLNRAPFS